MAFHPFRHFRKHQKAFFAVMLIVCMITFVFSGFGSSGADPFQNALRWIGMARHSGEEILPLYGKTIYTDDLDKTRMHRQLASEFLKFGVLYSTPLQSELFDIQQRIERDRKAAPNNLPTAVETALQKWNMFQIWNNPQFAQFATPEQRFKQAFDSLQEVQTQFTNPEVQKNPDQVRAIDTILTALASQAWWWSPQRQPQEYYFGGTPHIPDVLDFEIWKHQADKLGIVLTPADVCREVNRAWGNGDFLKPDTKFDSHEWVRKFFGSSNTIHKNLTSRDLLSALTDEFRVAMAKEALVGSSSGALFYRGAVDDIHHSPAVATPDEFLKFFQERRTTVAVSMLPLSVENFVAKAKDQFKPGADDLRNLYERYKNDEPSPARRQPGFKEPERIKVEYFSCRPDSPFYKKLAARVAKDAPRFGLGLSPTPASVAGAIASWAGPSSAGGGIAGWLASASAPLVFDASFLALYEDYRKEEADRVLKYDVSDGSHFGHGFDVMDRRGAEVRPSVAFVSQVLGAAGTGGTPLTAPIAWLCTYELHERATSLAVASTVLAGASSSPFAAITLPTRYLYSPRPLETVRAQLVERFEKDLAKKAIAANILTVRLELDKLLASHADPKREEYLKKAVADYGLENFHAMTSAQTRQEMLDHPDPALKELQTAYEQVTDNPFPEDRRRPDFIGAMFHPLDPRLRNQSSFPMRSWQFTSRSDEGTWVFWRSDDKPAHVRSFEAVRAEVEKAWYFEQARKLAQKEARRINDDLKKQHVNADDAVKFLREQKQGDVFRLENVAHLVPKSDAFVPLRKMSPNDFDDYRPNKKDIAYPPADFVDQLLKLKEPGDSLVVADQPARHFYVAVLMVKPQIPERRQFFDIYSFAGANANPLWMAMMTARRQTFYQKLVEQLRTEATKKVEGGDYVIPENVRNRSESSSSESGE